MSDFNETAMLVECPVCFLPASCPCYEGIDCLIDCHSERYAAAEALISADLLKVEDETA